MAKKKRDIGAAREPNIESKISLFDQGFRKVNAENRKQAIVIGRILYLLDESKPKEIFQGNYLICPCFKKGWVNMPYYPWDFDHPYVKDAIEKSPGKKHWSFYQEEDDDYTQWVVKNKFWLDRYIKQDILYLRITDPILTFKK